MGCGETYDSSVFVGGFLQLYIVWFYPGGEYGAPAREVELQAGAKCLTAQRMQKREKLDMG